MKNTTFSESLLSWFDQHGRKDLPWQHPKSAYRVWISEIMLQQTQVKTVIPYFERFMQRFPDLQTLSLASEDEVFSLWSGLGYYQRAHFLQKTARLIMNEHQGVFPNEVHTLIQLPGIGPSTAAAIASIAFNQPTAIMDGNVARVLSRCFLVDGQITATKVKQTLWQLAQQCMPLTRCADYTQAIMDLGATCCTNKQPQCDICPFSTTCLAKQHNLVEQYPFKKPKKIRPIKTQQFLLLHKRDNTIYLEKNPSSGIWGGLWCLPAIDIDLDPIAYIEKAYGFSCKNTRPLLAMKHIFTHFQLNIQAVSLSIDTSAIENEQGSWFNSEQLITLGLAKPMSKIIECFYNRSSYA